MARLYTSRNKDGSPRKLRKATNVRALRRQARNIVQARTGRKLAKDEVVHHEAGIHNQGKLRVIKGNKRHQHAINNSKKSMRKKGIMK